MAEQVEEQEVREYVRKYLEDTFSEQMDMASPVRGGSVEAQHNYIKFDITQRQCERPGKRI